MKPLSHRPIVRFFCCAILAAGPFFSSLQAQGRISAHAALADLDQMQQVISEVHYDPYLFTNAAVVKHRFDSVKATIKDSITFNAFLLKVAYLTAVYDDGHLGPAIVQPQLASQYKEPRFFPYGLIKDGSGDVYVKASADNVPSLPAGARLLEVNGVDMKGFAAMAAQLYGGTPAFRNDITTRFLNLYMNLSGIEPPYTMKVMDTTGGSKAIICPQGVPFRQYLSLVLPGIAGPDHSLEILKDKVGLVRFIAMKDMNAFDRFMDSTIKLMNERGIGTLAIDIRENSGGNSVLADVLASYITDKPYTLWGGRYWKVSDRYKEYLLSKGDSNNAYLKRPSGTIWHASGSTTRKPMSNDTKFRGRVFVITGPFTFSSANMLADGFKQFGLATLIGEPTGENTNDFGEVYTFTLPNSGIKMQCSTSFDLGADGNKKKMSPVIPHRLIRTTVQDRIKGRDPVLEFLLKEVQ